MSEPYHLGHDVSITACFFITPCLHGICRAWWQGDFDKKNILSSSLLGRDRDFAGYRRLPSPPIHRPSLHPNVWRSLCGLPWSAALLKERKGPKATWLCCGAIDRLRGEWNERTGGDLEVTTVLDADLKSVCRENDLVIFPSRWLGELLRSRADSSHATPYAFERRTAAGGYVASRAGSRNSLRQTV